MSEQKLKPCPFCGGEAIFSTEHDGDAYLCGAGRYYFIFVRCAKCKTKSAVIHCHDDDICGMRVSVEQKWNTRPTEDAVRQQTIEECAKVCEEYAKKAPDNNAYDYTNMGIAAMDCAAEIRKLKG